MYSNGDMNNISMKEHATLKVCERGNTKVVLFSCIIKINISKAYLFHL